MLASLLAKLHDPNFIAAILAAFATAATVFTLAMPLLEGNSLSKRMKSVSTERDRIRARERERLSAQRSSLRHEPKAYMREVVDRFKLSAWLGTDTAKRQLTMAGFRGGSAEVAFLFFRLVMPAAFFLVSLFYLFVVNDFGLGTVMRVGIVILATFLGIKAPEIFLSNTIQKRQQQMRRAWPDALDLLLICVESGMSVELGFRRVGQEIGAQSVALAEELTLTTAELSYLPDRRIAYENLANRTGLEAVKAVSTALIQAERYGTPVATALRVLGQESRDMRMAAAEKKAAGLPPKLTVPMILFFLPVLFVVIMTPALIQIFGWK